MAYTKIKRVHTDWFAAIDGKTVAEAIAYLQQLPQHLRIYGDLTGADLHGVDTEYYLGEEVPMTQEEIFTTRLRPLRDLFINADKAVEFYEKKADARYEQQIAISRHRIAVTKKKLAALYTEFNKPVPVDYQPSTPYESSIFSRKDD
jgi:hypothetical protein